MRSADTVLQEQISRLIKEEDDVKTRALLLILQQLSLSLIDDIRLVSSIANEIKAHRIEFEKHVEEENERLAAAAGGAKVARLLVNAFCVLLLVIQGLIGYEITRYQKMIDDVTQQAQQNSVDILLLKQSNITNHGGNND